MLGPQSPVLFTALALMFGALMWWMLAAGRVAFRVLAAGLAFTLATAFGVLAVNRYYGYYETWGAAIGDLTSQGVGGVNATPQASGSGLPSRAQLHVRGSSEIYHRLALRQGYALRLAVDGPRSHLTRVVYVYLPPQYFQQAYQGARRAAGLDQRAGRAGDPRRAGEPRARSTGRTGHARCERRRGRLPAVS